MAAVAEMNDDVLDLAFREPASHAVTARAEACLLDRRNGAPRVAEAVQTALADAIGRADAGTALTRAALAVAAEVERHGAAFPPGAEPAYHDRHHQAEAVIAMGWLAGAARRLALIGAEDAELAVLAMVAHDLLHDGRVHAERGLLERRSAEAAAAIAEAQGVPPHHVADLRRIILATTWPWVEEEAPDLLCHLAREADLFGSSLPVLGMRLSRLLALELAAAGQPAAETVAGHAARLTLLRLMPPPTPAAQVLGLGIARAAQLAAYEGAAARLGIAPPSADAAAAALDAMDPGDAEALLAWAGSET